ncbi:MAG: prephenate dehydratase domain-containing protein [Eubacteriales bacterium]|nr:prephenate dehydratase domain-containing protein [Eubacteriales bacterium]
MDARQIINVNIDALNREYTSFGERRLAHIRERAVNMHGIIGDIQDRDISSWLDAMRALYRDTLSADDGGADDGVIAQNTRGISDMRAALNAADRICLCRALVQTSPRSLTARELLITDPPSEMPNRIAYLRNAYTDAAYIRFSGVLHNPTVTYCDDFTSVCEEVYYGRTSMCIIPIENSAEGRLSAFRNLIKKYELKIVLTCLVSSPDGIETRYALLKKNIERVVLAGQPRKTELFEFSVICADGSGLSDILNAARSYGLKLNKADWTPVSYSETEYAQNLVFGIDDAEFDNFICYLSLEAPQFIAVGLYPHLL